MKKTIGLVIVWAVGSVLGAEPKLDLLKNAVKGNLTGLETSADRFEVDQKTGWVTFTGNVRIKTDQYEMTSDKARLNQETGDVQASGHVLIRQVGLGYWTGESIDYNYKTGKGLISMGQIHAGVFTVKTREATRSEEGVYVARQVEVTTCTNEPARWHWHAAGNGRYRENKSISVTHVVPYFMNVPVGYFPYWYRPLNTDYGFRLMPGYTSKWGAYLLGTYVYNLYDAPREAGVRLDGSTHLDFRTEKGIAVGQDFQWDLKEAGQGWFDFYHAWDQNTTRERDRDGANWMSDVPSERYRFRLHHEADITPRDQFLLHGTYVSDSEMASDFFERDNRNESIPMNLASLEHRENSWDAGVMVSGPLNDFYSGVSRLPEGWLSVVPRSLWGSGLNYESQTRAGYLERQPADYGAGANARYRYYPGDWADYDTVRVDTAHRVTYPLKIKDVFSLVPRAGYRGTYYSSGGQNAEDLARHTAELGLEASTRATSDYASGWRHVFEPYADYSYQPTQIDGGSKGNIYQFDHYDRSFEWLDQFGSDGAWLPNDWHGVRPGVRNLFQKRDANGVMRTVFDWDTYGAVQFAEPDKTPGVKPEDGLRFLGTKMIYSPGKNLKIRGMGEWDTEEDTMAYVDLGSYYRLSERFSVGGGYLGRDHELYDYGRPLVNEWQRVKDNLAYAGFVHELNSAWTWSLYSRYDLNDNSLDEVGGYLQYGLDCLVFQLRSSYLPSYTRIDGTQREDDYRIAFMVWLRAEGKTPKEEWLRW